MIPCVCLASSLCRTNQAQQQSQTKINPSIVLNPLRSHNIVKSCTYRRADDESVGSLSLAEGQTFFLLQTEHDEGQREHQSLPRARERNANHISARKTAHRQEEAMNNESSAQTRLLPFTKNQSVSDFHLGILHRRDSLDLDGRRMHNSFLL